MGYPKGQGHLCANSYCRIPLHQQPYHIDHRRPCAKGGATTEENLQLLCPNCNILKNNQTQRQFRSWFPMWRENFLKGRYADGTDRREFAESSLWNVLSDAGDITTGLDALSQLLGTPPSKGRFSSMLGEGRGRRLYYFDDRRYGSVIVWRQKRPVTLPRGKRQYLWIGEAAGFPDYTWRWLLHIFGDELSARLVRVEHRDCVPEWLPRSLLNEFRRKHRKMDSRRLVKNQRRLPAVTPT